MCTAAFVRNDGTEPHSDADWLLDFYNSFMGAATTDATDRALDCLSKVRPGGRVRVGGGGGARQGACLACLPASNYDGCNGLLLVPCGMVVA